ncbi:DUF1524 domain-containing protein [Pyrococcus kukulkanii]|uniref:GmrSD restriction endonuclease domain-containing protein n=1 Tax=Pyrococcus kukulkanii TaxID=1609559 RepID=UPI00356A0918
MAEAFIRINKEGVRIGNVELMLSLMTSVLGGKVKHAISRGIYRKIRKTFGFEVDIQPIIRFILANLGINQAQISKVDKFAKALKQISEDERIHKTDIVLEKSSEAFTLTIELIARRLPLPSSQLLPSQITLVPVARYIYLQDINELSQLSNEEERKILNWFILANFTSYYSTWTSSKLEQDLKVISSASTFPYNELLKNMKSRNYPTEITKQMILKGREENILKRSGRNYIFLLYIALANNNADDWNGQLISSISYEELTRHHIFPKKFLEENLEVEDPERRDIEINNLGNITLINKAINSEIGDSPPQEYLPQRHRESLEKHFIPYEPELWKLENYEEFLNTRMTLLYRALKNIYPEIIK